jgi:DNA polymerase-3 subunit alpha
MVYQEQVMQIVHELGGIPLRSAYSLIKAISKKKEKEIGKNRPIFIEGSEQKGLSKQAAEELFENILKFAGLRLQQEPLDGVRDRRVPDGVPEDVLPRAVHGCVPDLRDPGASAIADWIPYVDDCRKTCTDDRPADGRRSSDRAGGQVRPT